MSFLARALVLALVAAVVAAPLSQSAPSQPSHTIAGSIEISKEAGLGRLEVRDGLAAVLQRDEGAVALVDVSDPRAPEVLGRYDDDARKSLDGDLAFSTDGKWLFYARQTVEFSKDGLHVLNVSDPTQPTLAFYQPGGGTLRVAHYDDGDTEWVVTMDATLGMVVYRFEPTSGALVPVHVSALPALKVGGPASAGVVILDDPILKKPLLYASTGRTGVEVFDFTDPTAPTLLGSWTEIGLAEIEVRVQGKQRVIYGATEYWFEKSNPPVVVELDASKLDAIKQKRALSAACKTDDSHRIQGMAMVGGHLYVANSTAGLPVFFDRNSLRFVPVQRAPQNPLAGYPGGFYVFDVEVAGGYIYATDAANGYLTVIKRGSGPAWDYNSDELPWHGPTHRKSLSC